MLLDFFVNRVLLQHGIVLFEFNPLRGILAVLGGNVPAHAREPRRLVLCTLQDDLDSVPFLGHNRAIYG